MMTSAQIRKSFLDFFKSKRHTIVPSSSLMPDSPNLLFTNAGMNQFVPIFLGQAQCPYTPGRAADTQKCIRAGGKHNDLEDVGLDTYHHTFFEMLGNWSFGDYFKKEAIEWAWELVVVHWKFPPGRIYATVFCPYLGQPGWEEKWKSDFDLAQSRLAQKPGEAAEAAAGYDESAADIDAIRFWMKQFQHARLDPRTHIVPGNKKDNFWMMGETGPCGPCSELHVDLTPNGDTNGKLVNAGTPQCIEIWNLVFIQFNAQPRSGDASSPKGGSGALAATAGPATGASQPPVEFVPLAQKHVDTGMGFERVTSIIQGTKKFTDFAHARISNYETDIFRPIFDKLEQLSGKTYRSTLPGSPAAATSAGQTAANSPVGGTSVGQDAKNSPVGGTSVGQTDTCSSVCGTSAGQNATDSPDFAIPAGQEASDRTVCANLAKESETYSHTGSQKSLDSNQVALDIAFRVIADHIRTLSFAIADGIQPGNNDRNYVLRRILRRAVRYGRTLGFREPFFYKLVDVLAETMGDVFPEIRARKQHVQDVIRVEEEAFNKTLDRGIALFEEEVARLLGGEGSAPAPGAANRALAVGSEASGHQGAKYSKRRLPHFERPWGKYMVTFSTCEKRTLSPAERDIVLQSVLYAQEHRQYELFAACVMPDHVHLLFEPQIKEQDKDGKPVFFSLGEILHGIKSTTAHRINKAAKVTGVHVWEEESFDRLMRGDADLEEKFHYICRNPWNNGVVPLTENYRWLWTPTQPAQATSHEVSREGAGNSARGGRAPQNVSQISGAFAFRLYDEQGFPLDLTELMARERGLTVDVDGFNKLMEEQRARARAAQKKQVISLSQIETTTPTQFVGYEELAVQAKVLEVVSLKDKTAVILNTSACYAEMGGQVGDTGELNCDGTLWRVTNTQKSGNTWLHFLEEGNGPVPQGSAGASPAVSRALAGNRESSARNPAFKVTEGLPVADEASATAPEAGALPIAGNIVTLSVDRDRRNAIQRHHTVTHLLHWALHEVVSKEASQKGSFVGPDKLTFDFNSAPLTPQQVADVEKLVNERIVENAGVSWTEVPYADVKSRKDVMQFFGDKYGDTVRVVQIGGGSGRLDGYSMELCGGTHTRATGEIGLFRIAGESAIAAGVRRIEAVAGLEAYRKAADEVALIKSLAGKVNSPVHELEKKIESLLEHQKAVEKQLKAAQQREASNAASLLLEEVKVINGVPVIIHNLGAVDGDFLQAIADSLKSRFKGVMVLGGASGGAVSLLATVAPDFQHDFQAGKIIQQIAPIVGGKGGGKPDNARGGGKDATKLDEALAKARSLFG